MGIPNYKDIIELVKAGATIEAQERIMELRQSALALQEENLTLKGRISELEAKVRALEAGEGEPCPRCRKRTWVVERSQEDPVLGIAGVIQRVYKCSACGLEETKRVTPK